MTVYCTAVNDLKATIINRFTDAAKGYLTDHNILNCFFNLSDISISVRSTASYAAVYLHSFREYFLETLAFSLSSMYSSPSAKFVRQ